MGSYVSGTEHAKGICLEWCSGRERKEKYVGNKLRGSRVGARGHRKWRPGGVRPGDHCDDFAFYLSAVWLWVNHQPH